MQIYVKTRTGKSITLDVEPTDTIGDVWKKVCDREGFDFNNTYGFHYLNGHIQTNSTLDECNIGEGSILHIVYYQCLRGGGPTIHISIDKINNETFRLDFYGSSTIIDVKREIEIQKGIPVNTQHLLYFNQELDNDKHLSELQVGCSHSILQFYADSNSDDIVIYIYKYRSKDTECFQYAASPTQYIKDIKLAIDDKFKGTDGEHSLFYQNTKLEDNKQIKDYQIPSGARIMLH